VEAIDFLAVAGRSRSAEPRSDTASMISEVPSPEPPGESKRIRRPKSTPPAAGITMIMGKPSFRAACSGSFALCKTSHWMAMPT
jgi:hypothetical protein